MDVERLMQDLSVAELQNIHASLSVEMEEKKEELRQMVGRRYRDVLEASSSVRRVTQIADAFAACVHGIRGTDRPLAIQRTVSGIPCTRLSALVKLFSLIGTSDPLSDTFILLLVENIHRSLFVENARSNHVALLVRLMSPKLIGMRMRLEHELLDGLGDLSDPDETANQLAAIALLKKHSSEDLLDIFLSQKIALMCGPSADSVSLIDTVWHIRSTLECVQRIFLDGQLAALQRIFYSRHWIPKSLERCINDESLSFSHCLREDICRTNEQCGQLSLEAVDQNKLSEKCSAFLDRVCEASQNVIKQKCDFFKTCADVNHFLSVLLDAFHEDWPLIGSGIVVYHKLFGNLILEKFEVLLASELVEVEKAFSEKISSTMCHPPALFKKRSPKFDPLLATGVSEQLVSLVKQFDDGLRCVYESVKKYEAVGKEERIAELPVRLSSAVIEMLKRLCTTAEDVSSGSEQPKAENALSMARVFMGILQSRSSIISLCMSKNSELISECAHLLRDTAEKFFCLYLDAVVDGCVSHGHVNRIAEICSDPFVSLSYVQEFEKLELAEVGSVEVPIQVTRLLHGFLYDICKKMSAHSVGHLCTRRIRSHLSERVGCLLAQIYSKAATSQPRVTSRIALQCLFDVRVLNGLFGCEALRAQIPLFEALIDPFDLSLVAAPLAKNARIAAQRYSALFGPLLVDTLSSKETTLSNSYVAVVDIVPRLSDIARFSLIPRLSKNTGGEGKLRSTASATNLPSRKNTKRNAGVRNTPSLSSFYKISTSWFGN